MRLTPQECAQELWKNKYPKARALLLAGSIVRGEGTASSDLDIVVVFDEIKNAYRESFFSQQWPVEVFAHDPSTLKHFYHLNLNEGVPSLAHMVSTGEIFSHDLNFVESIKETANDFLLAGPLELKTDEIEKRRYQLCDLKEDLKHPRDLLEAIATANQIFHALGDFYLRVNRQWSGQGKGLVRELAKYDPGFSLKFNSAFKKLYQNSHPMEVLSLIDEVLAPYGGELFADYRQDAPPSWRQD